MDLLLFIVWVVGFFHTCRFFPSGRSFFLVSVVFFLGHLEVLKINCAPCLCFNDMWMVGFFVFVFCFVFVVFVLFGVWCL